LHLAVISAPTGLRSDDSLTVVSESASTGYEIEMAAAGDSTHCDTADPNAVFQLMLGLPVRQRTLATLVIALMLLVND
jgi:hypothetical protein